jgi:L-lysine exporter family protein LysE/ArgO
MRLGVLWRGCLLGLGAAAPIGPVNVELGRRTLRKGFAAGFGLGCGAVTVDVCYAFLSSLSLRPLQQHTRLMQALGIAGGLFLGYLGCLSVRGGLRPNAAVELESLPAAPQGSAVAHAGNYLTGLVMTSLNPMTLIFWFLAVGQITRDAGHDLPRVCAGVLAGTIAWVCVFSSAMAWVGRRGRGKWLCAADLAGGGMLLAFAGGAIWQAARLSLR